MATDLPVLNVSEDLSFIFKFFSRDFLLEVTPIGRFTENKINFFCVKSRS